jgi:hypothetical protein
VAPSTLLTVRTNSGYLPKPQAPLFRHLRAHFGAQLVDQAQAFRGFDVPEGPAVAGLGALRQRPDAVDRTDLVAECDRAVGTSSRCLLDVRYALTAGLIAHRSETTRWATSGLGWSYLLD